MPKIELLHMDCMEYMKDQPDNSFDLAIVDPPYGINAAKEKFTPINKTWTGKTKTGYKKKDWDKEVPKQEYFDELMRVSERQIIWGGNYYGLIGGYIFWDKGETMPTYTKGELAWCSFMQKIDRFYCLWSGYKKEEQIVRIHPTQKPVKLYDWLLSNYAKEGDKILDTHLGSGSSAIAAHYFGCEFVGMEIDEDYYKAACERFKRETAQIDMFQ